MPNFDTFVKKSKIMQIKRRHLSSSPQNSTVLDESKSSLLLLILCRQLYLWKDIVGKKVSKLRFIAELRAFYGTDFIHLKLWDLPVHHRCCIYKGELTAAKRWALDCPLPGNERWARGISGPMTLVPLNRKMAVKQRASWGWNFKELFRSKLRFTRVWVEVLSIAHIVQIL